MKQLVVNFPQQLAEAIAIGMKAAEVTLERIRGDKFRLSVRTENERVLPTYPAGSKELGS
jgi:hypothetical protein